MFFYQVTSATVGCCLGLSFGGWLRSLVGCSWTPTPKSSPSFWTLSLSWSWHTRQTLETGYTFSSPGDRVKQDHCILDLNLRHSLSIFVVSNFQARQVYFVEYDKLESHLYFTVEYERTFIIFNMWMAQVAKSLMNFFMFLQMDWVIEFLPTIWTA